MSSHSVVAPSEMQPRPAAVSRLLDPAFGLIVWAVHFLAIYVPAAVACVMGLGVDRHTTLRVSLGALTVAAIVVVALHAGRRYQQQHAVSGQGFRLAVTIGCDGIAAAAIAWQLFAVVIVPICV